MSDTDSVDSFLEKALSKIFARLDIALKEFESPQMQREQEESVGEEEIQDTPIPFDLMLFGGEELQSMRDRYKSEFYLFCNEEFLVVRHILEEFRKTSTDVLIPAER